MSKYCFLDNTALEEVTQPVLSLEGLHEIEYLSTCGDLNRDLLHEGEAVEAEIAMIQALNKDPDEWGGQLASYQVNKMIQKLKAKSVSMTTDDLFGSQIALEGSVGRLGDAIANVFKKIIEVIKKLWEKLTGFVKKMADSNRSLNKYLVSLKKKIEKKNFDKVSKGMEGGTLDNDSLAKKFAVGRTVTPADVKSLIKLHSLFNDRAGLLSGALDDINKTWPDIEGLEKVTSEDVMAGKMRSIYGKANPAFEKLIGFMVPDGSFKLGLTAEQFNEKEMEHVYPNKEVLFEGKQIHFKAVVQTPNPKEEDSEAKFSLTFEVKKSDLVDASTKLEILSKPGMLELVSEAIKLTEDNVKLIGHVEKAEKSIQTTLDHINKLAELPSEPVTTTPKPTSENTVEADTLRETHRKGKRSILFVRSIFSTMSEKSGAYAGMVVGLNTSLGDAVATYIRKSMDTYD